VVDVPAHFDHGARKLMPKYDWRVIAKRVVKDVDIGSTDSTVGNLKLDLVVAATRFLDVPYINISFASRVLHQSLHLWRSLSDTG
jgi:hypothetical protein